MEFDFNIEKILGVSKNGVAFLSGKDQSKFTDKDFKNICLLLDIVGDLSAKVIIYFLKKLIYCKNQAQQLPAVITSSWKFFGTDHHIYLACEKNKFIGFIKVGYKHLFIYDELGTPREINPLCVLDFYTYEKCQRKGYGKIMFNEMMMKEKIEARKMGFDRPSEKFINFLNKYFGLKDYVPQNNNYVVFKDYFMDEPKKKDKYDIYGNDYDYKKNNYYENNNTQRKLGAHNSNFDNNIQDEKDFATKIYMEYRNCSNENNKNSGNNGYGAEVGYDYSKKKNSGYNQYQSSSSEYGAFFHMNK